MSRLGSWLWNIAMFIGIIMLVVPIHEFGHYLAALALSVHPTQFSVGFGPELVGITDGAGTRWSLAAIPLGGYVALPTLDQAPVLDQFLILLAGPAFNVLYLLAIGLYMRARGADWSFPTEHRGFLFVPFLRMSGRAGSLGLSAFVWYSAVVSLELAFFNVLPIFPLDGGKMFFLLAQNMMGLTVNDMALTVIGIVLAIFVVIPVVLPILQKGRNFLNVDEISPFSR